MNNYYYTVNNKPYYNLYLAEYESYKTGEKVGYYCNTVEYDKEDWTKEPEDDFEVLMDRHANFLRNKYENLIFHWSGGTDSHTMLNVFTRNRIHIDEIIVMGNERAEGTPVYPYDWIRSNWWDPTTKITFFDKFDLKLREQFVHNEDWLLKNTGDVRGFTSGILEKHTTAGYCEANYAGKNYAMVTGHEKPTLIFRDGIWWTCVKDSPMKQIFGLDKIECFFLEPTLLKKQSHLLRRALSMVRRPYKNNQVAEELWPQGSSGYRGFTRACGRHDELSYGVSNAHKSVIMGQLSLELSKTGKIEHTKLNDSEDILKEKVAVGDSVAINYLKGLYNLASDAGFLNHLNSGVLKAENQILLTRPVFSKLYSLGT